MSKLVRYTATIWKKSIKENDFNSTYKATVL